jgi:transposase-like protein
MKTRQRSRRRFDPQQKITAVLSIWTERRTTAQLCQEMAISSSLLSQWQNQAIEGMLAALGPKTREPLPPLNQRLTRLIEKKLADPDGKLEKRLKSIQKKSSAS